MTRQQIDLRAELEAAGLWQPQAKLFDKADQLPSELHVPTGWRDLLATEDPFSRYSRLNQLWQPVLAELDGCLRPFVEGVHNLALLQHPYLPPQLIYGLSCQGEPEVWWGAPPLDTETLPAWLAPYWPQVPEDLSRWYALHGELRSSFGPFPFLESPAGWQWLSKFVDADERPESWDEIELDPARVLACGSDGRGRYLGLWVGEPGSSEPATGVLWDSRRNTTQILNPLLSELEAARLNDFFTDLDPAENENS